MNAFGYTQVAANDHTGAPVKESMERTSQVFLIGCGSATARKTARIEPSPQKMGFKAYNLLRMTDLGLTVPPAFVLGTGYCALYQNVASAQSIDLRPEWRPALQQLETTTQLGFGNCRKPLLLSVRSGAPVSMPGMMETLLNVGLTDQTLPGVVAMTGNPRLAWDAYRRLVATFGEVVAGIPAGLFEDELARMTSGHDEHELDFAELRELTKRFLSIYRTAAGKPFPQDPYEQLQHAIDAVFCSWQSPRACEYRRANRLDDNLGTAVTVQAMVFGNAGGMSGAGVGFSRDPVTGEPALWVDFLFNAQGEDVVSGRRSAQGHDALATALPAVWDELVDSADSLERAFGDMQDFEFTVQEGRLYMLQARSGKRSPRAAARIALDLLDENIIDRDEARLRTAILTDDALMQPCVVAENGLAQQPAASASSASGGVASGEIALDDTRARTRHADGIPVILV
ncbi:MAG: PEP/pyruvate-binding domain-containing protein, partial [Burkholderiaceae bacterium]